MLALRWPLDPPDAGLWTQVPSDAGCHRRWSLRCSSLSARDGARNRFDHGTIEQTIRRMVQMTLLGERNAARLRSNRSSVRSASCADVAALNPSSLGAAF